MMKVATALNGMLPRQASATPGHVIGTSFVLCSALQGLDGLCDHELVVHDCGVGQDVNAQRVFERMRDLWLSDWLLLYSHPVPPREDVLFIIADACGVGRLTEWQNTGMTQKPLASREQIWRRPVPCRGSTPPTERGRNEQFSSHSAPPLQAARGAPAPRRAQTRVQKLEMTL